VVTLFVHMGVAPRVQAMVSILAAVNQALLRACPFPIKTLNPCADAAAERGDAALVTLLTADADALTATGAALASLPLPAVGPQPRLHLGFVLEDLALCNDGLSSLLGELVAGLRLATVGGIAPAPVSVSYVPRVRHLLDIVGRAEQWLEVADHETGAHATLPGLAPGAPSLESLLAMQ
jgi:hypothetical protein